MNILKTMGKKLSFAHLNGPRASAQAEDDEEKKDDKAAKAAAEDEPKDDDKVEDKPESKAEGGSTEDDEPDGDEKKDAKATAESDDDKDDDDPDKDMNGNSPAAKARRVERERCAAIFACKAAGRNPEMAAALAFTTTMSRTAAIAALEALPASGRAASVDRSARNPSLGAGGGSASGNSAAAAQAGWTKAFAPYSR